MTTMNIDLSKIKKSYNWTVTDVCRKLITENSDVDRIEVYWGEKLAYTVTDVKHMAELEPRARGGFQRYRRNGTQPRTEV